MRRTPWKAALPLALWIATGWGLVPKDGPRPAFADDADPDDPPAGPALSPADAAKAKTAFDDALALQEKGSYATARKRFRAFLEAWPGADASLRQEAEERSAENAFLGIEEVRHGGKSENRIDVELMGDGYLLTQQDKFKKHAEQQMNAFWAEPLYDEYGSYFNLWRFDLASKEEGVDDPGAGPQDQTPPTPPPQPPKRGKPVKLKKLNSFSTALNCQAAGPQRQVWADPEMVFKWRKYLKVSDGLSLCFAKKGELGMGGMGIATTGRMVAVVHEFGHAFIGLLDEYAINPEPPQGRISAANAVSGRGPKEPPVSAAIPWRHWLEAKNPDVGVLLGGATYQLGVYRPAASCAMNSGGGSPYCWVCREAGVLRLYDYVSPIDEAAPADSTVNLAEGAKAEFSVVPMEPRTHKLDVAWFFEKLKSKVATRGDDDEDAPPPRPGAEPPPPAGEEPLPRLTPDGKSRGPVRGYYRHAEPWPPGDPRGEELHATEKRSGGVRRSTVVLEGLTTGRYRLTARVRDDTKVPGFKWPWVLRDPDKILVERREWMVVVGGDATAKPK